MLYILLNLDIKYDIINSIMPFTTAWIRRAHTNSEKVRLTIYDKIRHRRFSFNAEFSVDVESWAKKSHTIWVLILNNDSAEICMSYKFILLFWRNNKYIMPFN